MRIYILLITIFLLIIGISNLSAQNVSINTDGSEPDGSAMLDVKSINKGMLIPRIDFSNVPTSPATGLLIYVTANGPSGDSAFYYFNGFEWLKLATPTGETDPVFNASVASEINATDTVYWGSKLDSEVDGSTTNEIQTISLSNDTVYLSDGGFVNLPDTFDGKYTSLTDVPANIDTDATDDFDGKYTSLTDVPANIDTDYTDDFDGKYTSLTDIPTNIDTDYTDDFDGKYTSLTDVPANMDTDATDDFDGKYTSLTDVPANMDTDATDDFDGKYTSLTDVPINIDEDATDDVKLTGNQTIAGEKTFSDDVTFSNITATNINASSSVTTTAFTLSTGATDGYVLKSDAQGNASWQVSSSGADNLGNHTATQNIKLGASTNYLSGDGDSEGIMIDHGGFVTTSSDFYVTGEATIAKNLKVGDASKVGNFGNATILGQLDVADTTVLRSNLYVGDPSKGPITAIKAEIYGKLTVTDSVITDAIKISSGAGNGRVLTSDASGKASWADASVGTLSQGKVFIGNSSGLAAEQSVSGDVTISETGVATIGSSKVTNDMLSGSITNDKLAGSITNDKLAGGITNEKLAGSISDDKLHTISTTDKVAGSAVQLNSTGGLDNDSGLKIKNGGVSNDMLAGSITNDKLAGGITNSQLAGSISGDKLSISQGKIFIGNSAGIAGEQTISGDVTISEAGITTIGSAKVTNDMLAGSITNNLLANGDYMITSAGTSGQVWTSDGTGAGGWQSVSGASLITDSDTDTKIQLEKTADEDTIRFYIAGTERWKMAGSRIEPVNSGHSLMIGKFAGQNDDLTDNYNIFIGDSCGATNTSGYRNVAIGVNSFISNSFGIANVAIGFEAMNQAVYTYGNTAIGYFSLHSNIQGNLNSAFGLNSCLNTTGDGNSAFGANSLIKNINGEDNTAIGRNALTENTSGSYNIGIGAGANSNNQGGSYNTIVGFEAGYGNSQHSKSGNVFLGYQAGYSETGSNKLYIENSNSSTPLIYGDFAADSVAINGKITITGGNPGAGKVLTSDASGAASWESANDSVFEINSHNGQGKFNFDYDSMNDADIAQLFFHNAPYAMISFKSREFQNGNDRSNWMEFGSYGNICIGENSGSIMGSQWTDERPENNVFIGDNSGFVHWQGDDNIGIGRFALKSQEGGKNNIAIGPAALVNYNRSGYAGQLDYFMANNIAIGGEALYNLNSSSSNNGENNIAIGYQSGYSLNQSIGNVFIGYQSGYSETGSNKLYIENSNSGTPLIYGDFDADSLVINGTLTITGGTPGAGKVLTSDANGAASWQTPSAGGGSSDEIVDADGDTKIQVEESTDEDLIRFDIAGTETWIMSGLRIVSNNIGGNVFIGENAGSEDPLTNASNVSIGMNSSTTSSNAVAIGNNANSSNSGAISIGYNTAATGSYSTGVGYDVDATGMYAAAFGRGANAGALYATSIGANSDATTTGSIALGKDAQATTQNYSCAIGYNADASGLHSVALGYNSIVTADDNIVLGNSAILNIGGYQNWSNLSDDRFKKEIKEDIPGLEFIKKLRPVSYKVDIDKLNTFQNIEITDDQSEAKRIIHSGFIAQEVEQAANELNYEFNGIKTPQNDRDHYGLRYASFVVPLVKAVQEQQLIIDELQSKVIELDKLQKQYEVLKAEIEQIKALD